MIRVQLNPDVTLDQFRLHRLLRVSDENRVCGLDAYLKRVRQLTEKGCIEVVTCIGHLLVKQPNRALNCFNTAWFISWTVLTVAPALSNEPVVKTRPAGSDAAHRFESFDPSIPKLWLPSSTNATVMTRGRQLLDQAHRENQVGAYSSAEYSTYEALTQFASALDAEFTSTPTALDKLQRAEKAMREAGDFAGRYGVVDRDAIVRFVRSHETSVLKLALESESALQALTATMAIDVYLDEARFHLAGLAASSVEIAEALDLLAAIKLGRNDRFSLPQETALCLRRAALQGQPENAALAATLGRQLELAGLLQEARWAMEHSLSIKPDLATTQALISIAERLEDHKGASRLRIAATLQQGGEPFATQPAIPVVTTLTPSEFASISKPVILDKPSDTTQLPKTADPPVFASPETKKDDSRISRLIGFRQSQSETSRPANLQTPTAETPEKRSLFQRFFNTSKSDGK